MFPNLSSLNTDVGMVRDGAEYMAEVFLMRRLRVNVTIKPLAVKSLRFDPGVSGGFNVVRLNVSSNMQELIESIADWSHAEDRARVLSEWITACLKFTATAAVEKITEALAENTGNANRRAGAPIYTALAWEYPQAGLPDGYENVGVQPDATKGEFGYDFLIGESRVPGMPDRIVQKAEIDPVLHGLLGWSWDVTFESYLDLAWNKPTWLTLRKHKDNPPADSQIPPPEFESRVVIPDSYTTQITYRLMLQPDLGWLLKQLVKDDLVPDTEDPEDTNPEKRQNTGGES